MKCKITSGKFAGFFGTPIHSTPPVLVVDVDGTPVMVLGDQIEILNLINQGVRTSKGYGIVVSAGKRTASVMIGDRLTRVRWEDIHPIESTGKLVVIESPFAGDTERNIEYARQAMRRVIESGNTPFASHLLYTQVLDDNLPKEREIGIKAGLSIYKKADECAVFAKYGVSNGMRSGILAAIEHGVPIVVYDDDRISGMVTNIRTILEWMK